MAELVDATGRRKPELYGKIVLMTTSGWRVSSNLTVCCTHFYGDYSVMVCTSPCEGDSYSSTLYSHTILLYVSVHEVVDMSYLETIRKDISPRRFESCLIHLIKKRRFSTFIGC